jgi:hypothetical protein
MSFGQDLWKEIADILSNFWNHTIEIKKQSKLMFIALCCFFLGISIVVMCFLYMFSPAIIAFFSFTPITDTPPPPNNGGIVLNFLFVGMVIAMGPFLIVSFITGSRGFRPSMKKRSQIAEMEVMLSNGNPSVYSIFISRIEEDRETADKLKVLLEEAFPKKINIFVANSIPFSEDWYNEIIIGIENCDLMIIFCTPNSVNRPWINFEAGAAAIRRKNIGPICFNGQPVSDLPSPLKYLRSQGIDCSDDDIFQRQFKKFIEGIASKIGIPVPTIDLTKSEFYQMIKSQSRPYFVAIADSTKFKVGEKIVIKGSITGRRLPSDTTVTAKVVELDGSSSGFEVIKEKFFPINSDGSFEVTFESNSLKSGSYGAMLQLPSGARTKAAFHVEISEEQEKIAREFYREIKTIRNELSVRIPDDHYINLGFIYPAYGLYFVYRKEIIDFDEDLSKKLVQFYDYLTSVNNYIKVSKEKSKIPDLSPMINHIVETAVPLLDQMEKQFPRLKEE